MEMDKMKEMMGEEDEVVFALHILIAAEKIKQDPELWAAVQKEAQKTKKAINSIADLKAKYAEITENKPMPKKVGLKKDEEQLEPEETEDNLPKQELHMSYKEMKKMDADSGAHDDSDE